MTPGEPGANRWTRFPRPAGGRPAITVGELRDALSGLPDFAEACVRVTVTRPGTLGASFLARPTGTLATSLRGVYEGVEIRAEAGAADLEASGELDAICRLRTGGRPC